MEKYIIAWSLILSGLFVFIVSFVDHKIDALRHSKDSITNLGGTLFSVGIALLGLGIQLNNDRLKDERNSYSKFYADLINYDQFLYQKNFAYHTIISRLSKAGEICDEKKSDQKSELDRIVRSAKVYSTTILYDSNRIINDNKDVLAAIDPIIRSAYINVLNQSSDLYAMSDNYYNYVIRDVAAYDRSESNDDKMKFFNNYCEIISEYYDTFAAQKFIDSVVLKLTCAIAFAFETHSLTPSRLSELRDIITVTMGKKEFAPVESFSDKVGEMASRAAVCGKNQERVTFQITRKPTPDSGGASSTVDSK